MNKNQLFQILDKSDEIYAVTPLEHVASNAMWAPTKYLSATWEIVG